MNKPLLFLLLTLILHIAAQPSHAQKQEQELTDSLLSELKTAKEDTNKVNLMLLYAESIYIIDNAKATESAEKSQKLSEKLKWKRGVIKSLLTLSHLQGVKGSFVLAIETGLQAATMAEQDKDTILLTYAYINIGDSYRMLGNF